MARHMRRGRSGFPVVTATVLVLLLIAVGGAIGYLLQGGEIPIPFTDPPRTFALRSDGGSDDDRAPEGKIAVPTSGRPLKAFAAVVPTDLMSDPKTLKKSIVYLSPEHAERLQVITDLRQIVGRVLRRDKAAGKVFRESDFAPRGTRPGITAGTPPGKVAQRLDIARIPSLYGLQRGDYFDLVATLSLESDSVSQLEKLGGSYGNRLALEAHMQNLDQKAVVQVVVRGGVVVQGVQLRKIPTGAAQGASQKSVQEIVIALSPEEVPALSQALSVGAEITCLAHSGLPDTAETPRTPTSEWNPWDQIGPGGQTGSGVGFVETIRGDTKAVEPVPVGRRGPGQQKNSSRIAPASYSTDSAKPSKPPEGN